MLPTLASTVFPVAFLKSATSCGTVVDRLLVSVKYSLNAVVPLTSDKLKILISSKIFGFSLSK